MPAASSGELAYVSLPPGTIPQGTSVVVRNATNNNQAWATITDGGFDPVALLAVAGDVLSLRVSTTDSSSPIDFATVVPVSKPPVVVRTYPPLKKRDVPLNASIVIVFSEPMDPGTLTPSTVRLLRGSTAVSCRITVSPDGLRADVTPDSLLAPATDYTLVVGTGAADLSGELLEAAVSVSFSTDSAPAPPPPPPASGMSQIATMGGDGAIYVIRADGTEPRKMTAGPGDAHPAWSPDGEKLAFQRQDPYRAFDIYVMNYDGTGVVRLTSGPAYDSDPAWSPDGSRIAFHRDDILYVMNADGSNASKLVRAGFRAHATWSPDGSWIAFSGDGCGLTSSYHICLIKPDGTGLTQLTSGPGGNHAPAWSPDGTRIAFTRGESGGLYVMNADGSGQKRLTAGINGPPSWSPDSRSIAFEWQGLSIIGADGSGLVRLGPGVGLNFLPAWSPVGSMPPRPEPYLSLSMLSGDAQTDTVLATMAPLKVRVHRDDGTPVPGVAVSWRAYCPPPGPCYSVPEPLLSSTRTVADAEGIATVAVTLGPRAGRWAVEAAVTDGTARSAFPISFSATAIPGRPVGLARYAGDNQVGAVGSPVRRAYMVVAHDGHGNEISGVPVSWTVSSGGGGITPGGDTTAVFPYQTVLAATHSLGPNEGPQTVAATAPSIPGSPSVTFTTTAVTILVVTESYAGFTPDSVAVPSGKSVAWLFAYSPYGSQEHAIWFDDDDDVSPLMVNDDRFFIRTFTGGPRTVTYWCGYHFPTSVSPDWVPEVGRVVVQ